MVDDDDPDLEATTWFADGDTDGWGDAATPQVACSQPAGYVEDDTDCDDGDAAISPAALEVCNDVDDDCDGLVDDDDPDRVGGLTWYEDGDGDGWSGDLTTAESCLEPPTGGPWASVDEGDCDDADPTIHPGAFDAWYDGVDSDCDGAPDPDPCVWAPAAGSVTIDGGCAGVDLYAVAWWPCQAACGDDVELLVQVANEGSSEAPAGAVLALYGEDASGGRTLLAQETLGAVPAGGLTAASSFVQAAADLSGYVQLVAVVDDGDAQAECDEADNEGTIDLSPVCP